MDKSYEVADAKRRIAMKRVEEAQMLLDEAATIISDVRGMGKEWSALGKLYDRVRDMWDRLYDASPVRLDHEIREGCDCGCKEISDSIESVRETEVPHA